MNVSTRGARALDRIQWKLRLAQLRKRGAKRVALASFPRSGNTWFRFLLEHATGEQTGNVSRREARVLPRGSEGIVIKTHRRDSHRYTHAIHLIRNPFDAIDSFFDWKASLGWSWKYGELSWDDFVVLMVPRWCEHTRHWMAASSDTYRVRYEDCVHDPFGQFKPLLEWLGTPVSDDRLKAAIEETSFNRLKQQQTAESAVGASFFRRGQAAKGMERFTREQRELVQRVAGREMGACGYSLPPST
jgi:hypothetical protein